MKDALDYAMKTKKKVKIDKKGIGGMIKKYMKGGKLKGPSHKEGGILTQVGDQPIEMEGGEYVIKKSSVDKLDKTNPGLLDKLNKTGKLKDGGRTTNLSAKKGKFINKRTKKPVPAGTKYHMHPKKGPMEGAVHNPKIKGGTKGHDFFLIAKKMAKGGSIQSLKKIAAQLKKASKMHAGQSKKVQNIYNNYKSKMEEGGRTNPYSGKRQSKLKSEEIKLLEKQLGTSPLSMFGRLRALADINKAILDPKNIKNPIDWGIYAKAVFDKKNKDKKKKMEEGGRTNPFTSEMKRSILGQHGYLDFAEDSLNKAGIGTGNLSMFGRIKAMSDIKKARKKAKTGKKSKFLQFNI
tara:strand:+ start:99 stop:1145 length:1047 start_codon:yes stop_codon:yes gene_type:complete